MSSKNAAQNTWTGKILGEMGYIIDGEPYVSYGVVSANFRKLKLGFMEFLDILDGKNPSDVFRDYMNRHPNSTRVAMGMDFLTFFPNIDGIFQNIIWNWGGGGNRKYGLSDDEFDNLMIKCIKESGYEIRSRSS